MANFLNNIFGSNSPEGKNQEAEKFAKAKKSGMMLSSIFRATMVTYIITILTNTFGSVIDGIIIGQFLGADCIAAFGLAAPMSVIVFSLSGVFSGGSQSMCGNAMGKGKMDVANNIFNMTIFFAVGISLIIAVTIIIFVDPISMLLGADPNDEVMFTNVTGYVLGITLGMPIMFGVSVIQPYMHLDNDRPRVVRATLMLSFVNIGGDLVNVFFLHWGMFGMGLTTSLGYLASLSYLLLHFRKPNCNYKINPKLIKWNYLPKVLYIGLPTAITRSCSTFRTILINRNLLLIAGSTGVAALSVQTNCNSMIACVGSGIGMGTLMLTNIFFGEEDVVSLKAVLRNAFKYAVVCVGSVMVLLLVAAPLVAMLYVSDEEVITMASTCIRFYAISMPFFTFNMIIQYFCQGTRKMALTMTICVLDNFLFSTAAAYILPLFIGVTGIWISFFVGEICTLLFVVIVVVIKTKKFNFGLDNAMMLPENFDVPKEDKWEYSVTDIEDVMMCSVASEAFCIKHDIDAKMTNSIALCIEEMGMNIVNHGITDEDKQRLDVKIFIKNDDITIRLRDNCEQFNPVDHFKSMDPEDPTKGIGIRMVMKISKDVVYINTLKLNNLTIKL